MIVQTKLNVGGKYLSQWGKPSYQQNLVGRCDLYILISNAPELAQNFVYMEQTEVSRLAFMLLQMKDLSSSVDSAYLGS
jgi:hypothetical protein